MKMLTKKYELYLTYVVRKTLWGQRKIGTVIYGSLLKGLADEVAVD